MLPDQASLPGRFDREKNAFHPHKSLAANVDWMPTGKKTLINKRQHCFSFRWFGLSVFCGLEIEFLLFFFSSLLLLGISKYLKLNTFLPASQSVPHGEKVDIIWEQKSYSPMPRAVWGHVPVATEGTSATGCPQATHPWGRGLIKKSHFL